MTPPHRARFALLLAVLVSFLTALPCYAENGLARTTADAVRREATRPSVGPEGRPLPLAAEYNTGTLAFEKPEQYPHQWTPDYMVSLLEKGHHVIPTFADPITLSRRRRNRADAWLEGYYGPALRRCAELNVPITFMDWNYASHVISGPWTNREEADADKSPLYVTTDGKVHRRASPFGPTENWRKYGEAYTARDPMRRVQEFYPSPPLAIFISNNEGRKLTRRQDAAKSRRFVEKYGEDRPAQFVQEKLVGAWIETWHAWHQGMRAGLTKEAWKNNSLITGYNAFGPDHFGRWGGWKNYSLYSPRYGFGVDRFWDGAQVSYYDNDWEWAKTDHSGWSMQVEFMNCVFMQKRAFERDPDFWFELAVWAGGGVNTLADNRRRGACKAFTYITRGQVWSPERYAGSTQFGMWLLRPRVVREFTGYTVHRRPLWEPFWMALVEAVDRVHANPTLAEFWRHGRLVPNTAHEHPFQSNVPEELEDVNRWYLLDCSTNPPPEEWERSNWRYKRKPVLPVFPLALVRGEPAQRRWLLYAHAPLGARKDVRITVPEFGNVTVNVSRSGSFYLIDEADSSIESVHWGGPAELNLTASARYPETGETVKFTPELVGAPGTLPRSSRWDFGDGIVAAWRPPRSVPVRRAGAPPQAETTRPKPEVPPVSHAFKKQGQYIVSAEVGLSTGETVRAELPVWVGMKPEDALVSRLLMDGAPGPKRLFEQAAGRRLHYRFLPDAAGPDKFNNLLLGGEFVDDPDRGRVLRLDGRCEMVRLRNSARLNRAENTTDRTISLHFKPARTEGRQVLYEEGSPGAGFNLYLDGSTLYAGAWATGKERNWPGEWLKFDGIQTGRWHHATLVLEDATATPQDGRLLLYVDGAKVDSAPVTSIPPHKGDNYIGGHDTTRCHDGPFGPAPLRRHPLKPPQHYFQGLIDDFEVWNAAREPEGG